MADKTGTLVSYNPKSEFGSSQIGLQANWEYTIDRSARKVTVTAKFIVKYAYRLSLGWKNCKFIVGSTTKSPGTVSYDTIGDKFICEVSTTINYNNDGDSISCKIYGHVDRDGHSGKFSQCQSKGLCYGGSVYHISSSTCYPINLTLDDSIQIEGIEPAYRKATISFNAPEANSFVQNGKSITIGYTSNTNADATTPMVQYKVNSGSWTDIIASNSAGTKSIPINVGTGKSFTIYLRRKHKASEYSSNEVSRTFRTYSNPSVSGTKINLNPINADTNAVVSCDQWTGVFGVEKSILSININSRGYINFNNNNSWTGALQSYVPFSMDNQNITITVKRTHSNTGITATQSINVRVLYTPIKYTNKPTQIGTIDRTQDRNIVLSFPYEEDGSQIIPANGQYGIIAGYRITYSGDNRRIAKDYNVTGNSSNYYSTICRIPKEDLTPTVTYDITVQALYKSGSTVSLGPARTIENFVTLASKLEKPVIQFPYTSTNASWQNNAFRVGFILPEDPDYGYLSDKKNYSYSDIQISISTTTTREFTKYPKAFSIDNLTYMSNVIFNPRLAYGSSIYGTYTVKVRVKKKITDNDTLAWSEWSDEVTVKDASEYKEYGYITKSGSNFNMTYLNSNTNKTIIMSTDGYITVPIISRLISYSNRLLAAYFNSSDYQRKRIPEISLNASNVLIERDTISKIYNNMIDIINKINQFGKNHSSTKKGVIYDSYSDYEFSTKSNMIVTSSKYNKNGSDGKDNYFQRLIDLIAYMQDLDKY